MSPERQRFTVIPWSCLQLPFRPCGRRLALVCATAASLAAQAPSLAVPVTVNTLANGLTVIVQEDQSIPVAAVSI